MSKCLSSLPLSNLHGKWRLFLCLRAGKVTILESKQGCYCSGVCSCPPSLWKITLFSIATSKIPVVLWLGKGIEAGSCFSAGNTRSRPVIRRDCPFNCAVTFPSLLGSPSAFHRHPCLVFFCPTLNRSVCLLWLLGDKLIMNTWNMAVW